MAERDMECLRWTALELGRRESGYLYLPPCFCLRIPFFAKSKRRFKQKQDVARFASCFFTNRYCKI